MRTYLVIKKLHKNNKVMLKCLQNGLTFYVINKHLTVGEIVNHNQLKVLIDLMEKAGVFKQS
jgi:uncharacterized membrane protein